MFWSSVTFLLQRGCAILLLISHACLSRFVLLKAEWLRIEEQGYTLLAIIVVTQPLPMAWSPK
jgi:hypothetical protein